MDLLTCTLHNGAVACCLLFGAWCLVLLLPPLLQLFLATPLVPVRHSYMEAYQGVIASIPWLPIVGNHEFLDGDDLRRYE